MREKILESKKLIQYYKSGIFPMAENTIDERIRLYKPEKRFIIPIKNFHVPKRLFKEYKKKPMLSINSRFREVMQNCSKITNRRRETWINEEMIEAYTDLHGKGYAHSIEVWENKNLVGGLYGVNIGSAFFGESMFSLRKNSSKICLLFLISILVKYNFNLLDSQFYNSHLLQFGAYEISSEKYTNILNKSIVGKNLFPKKMNYSESILTLQSLTHIS